MSTDRFQDEQRAASGDRQAVMPEVLVAMERAVSRPARRRGRHLLRTLGISAGLVLASGTALAATGQWNPFGQGSTRANFSPPPADQLEALEVLRRPQSERDRNPMVAATIRKVPIQLGGGVRVNAARELRVNEKDYGRAGKPAIAKEHVILLSIERFGEADRADSLKDPLCIWTTLDAWPEGYAHPISFMTDAGGDAGDRPSSDPFLPKERSPDLDERISTGGACGTAHQLRTKGIQTGTLSMGYLGGLVPDGVTTVRATDGNGAVVSTRVEHNYYELQAPVTDNGRWGVGPRFKQSSLEWVAADGHVIRRF